MKTTTTKHTLIQKVPQTQHSFTTLILCVHCVAKINHFRNILTAPFIEIRRKSPSVTTITNH